MLEYISEESIRRYVSSSMDIKRITCIKKKKKKIKGCLFIDISLILTEEKYPSNCK